MLVPHWLLLLVSKSVHLEFAQKLKCVFLKLIGSYVIYIKSTTINLIMVQILKGGGFGAGWTYRAHPAPPYMSLDFLIEVIQICIKTHTIFNTKLLG